MITHKKAVRRHFTPARRVQLVPIVAECPQCGRFLHPCVKFDAGDIDGDPVVTGLPDNCARCGESIDNPTMIRNCIDTARNILETLHLMGGDVA